MSSLTQPAQKCSSCVSRGSIQNCCMAHNWAEAHSLPTPTTEQWSAHTGPRPRAGPWRNCYWTARNQDQIGPNVTGTTDIRNTLQVSLNTIIPTRDRSEHLTAAKQAQISHWISAMMPYELHWICMCQTFVILLRAGPQNNARLKPARSAKKFAEPCHRGHAKTMLS